MIWAEQSSSSSSNWQVVLVIACLITSLALPSSARLFPALRQRERWLPGWTTIIISVEQTSWWRHTPATSHCQIIGRYWSYIQYTAAASWTSLSVNSKLERLGETLNHPGSGPARPSNLSTENHFAVSRLRSDIGIERGTMNVWPFFLSIVEAWLNDYFSQL